MRKVLFKKLSPGIGCVVLNNPERKNAMDEEVAECFSETLDFIIKDSSDLKLVVIEGVEGVFSSGGDLGMLVRKTEQDPAAQWIGMMNYYSAFSKVLDIPVPTIAVVEGWCVGAAMSLVAFCDIRLAYCDAKFSAPFIRLGLYPGLGSTALFPELLGSFGEYMLLTGETVSAERLKELGFLHKLITGSEKIQALQEFEELFTKIPTQALQLLLNGLRLRKRELVLKHFEFEARSQSICYSSDWFKQNIAKKNTQSR